MKQFLLGAMAALALTCATGAAQAQTATVLAALPGDPGDIAPLGADIIVVNYTGTQVWRITPAGVVTPFATLSASSDRGLTVGHDGAFYATTSAGIERISTAGVVTLFSPATGTGLTYHPGLGVYFLANQSNTIRQVTTAGVATVFFTDAGGETYDSVIAGMNGDLYGLRMGSNEVVRINTVGIPSATVVGSAPGEFDLVEDGAGDFFLPDFGGDAISRLSADGSTTTTHYAGPELSLPFRAEIIGGNLYVSNFGSNTIAIVSGVVPPAPPLATVPTLSEWAMILFALGLAGGAAVIVQRRRQYA